MPFEVISAGPTAPVVGVVAKQVPRPTGVTTDGPNLIISVPDKIGLPDSDGVATPEKVTITNLVGANGHIYELTVVTGTITFAQPGLFQLKHIQGTLVFTNNPVAFLGTVLVSLTQEAIFHPEDDAFDFLERFYGVRFGEFTATTLRDTGVLAVEVPPMHLVDP